MAATGARIVGLKNPGPSNYKTNMRRFKGSSYSIRIKTKNPCI